MSTFTPTADSADSGEPRIDASLGEIAAPPAGATRASRGPWVGTAAGSAAALAASGVMLWAGRSYGGVILSQLISERITEIVPLSVFRRALETLESNAKPLTLAGITLAQVIGGALIGLAYAARARAGFHARIVRGAGLAVFVWLGLSLVAAPLGDVGLFARDASGGMWRTQLTFVLGALVFAAITAAFVPWPAPRLAEQQAPDPSRRRFVAGTAVAVLAIPAVLSGAYVGRYVQQLRRRSPAPAVISASSPGADEDFAFAGMPPRITPTAQFYVVSKNLVDPEVDASSWDLEIGGMVERPMKLSYTDVSSRASSDFTSTLECISNTIGGKYISTATWTGYSLRTLLDEAGLNEGVVDIELHAADGYIESIPLAEALAVDTMLVHGINGEPLPFEHGYPARLIVPGIFGMKNVKWVTGIFAVDHDIQGYWQERGWSDIATVVTMSRIDTPKSGKHLPLNQMTRLGGVAFAGDRGISKVEVSVDDGKSWEIAELDDAFSPLSWRLWQFDHTPTVAGKTYFQVRATDGSGELQTADVRPTLPDGATGYHRMKVTIDE